MDRSKTPTPAAMQQQREAASLDNGTTLPELPHTAPASTTSFLGWVRSAISPINPLSAVLSSSDSSGGAASPGGGHHRKTSSSNKESSGHSLFEQQQASLLADRSRDRDQDADDDDDDVGRTKRLHRPSRRTRTSSSVASDATSEADGSEADDSGAEEIFTPFHQIQPAHRTQSPVSPASALKRLPFASHIRRSSSPLAGPTPQPPATSSAQATGPSGLTSTGTSSPSAQAAASAPSSGGPRLFKPFARREALVLDESTPLDDLDQASSPTTSSPPSTFAPFKSALPPTTRPVSKSHLPSLVLTPPNQLPQQGNGDVIGDSSSSDALVDQQLSPDASFELESLEKIRIDMETPDNTNQHREMVAFGQAVADMRATPKPFQHGKTANGVAASAEDAIEAPPVDLRATPKPNQQSVAAAAASAAASASPSKSSPGGQRTRNIFRRSAGFKSLELASEGRNMSAAGDLSPTLLAEVDEAVEEVGTPSSGDRSSADMNASMRQADHKESATDARHLAPNHASGSRSPRSDGAKVSRTPSSGSFWRFNRGNKKRPVSSGGYPASETSSRDLRPSEEASTPGSSQPSPGSEHAPDSSASSLLSADDRSGTGGPPESMLDERRASILSLGSSAGHAGTSKRVSIDETRVPPARERSATKDSTESEVSSQRHRRVRSVDSFRSALGRGKSATRRSNVSSIGGSSAVPRPGSVTSLASLCLDKSAIKEANKLSVKLWPKAIKTRVRGKSNKERDFERLVLAQELFLGWDPLPGRARPPEPDRRQSYASSVDSHTSSALPQASLVQSPPSSHSGTDPMQAAGAAAHLNHSNSVSSVSSSMSSSGTSANGTGTTLGTSVTFSSRPGSIKGGASNAATSRPRKSTWAMRFSVDGRYFAVAGQDAVVRVYEVLSTPEHRQAEVDAALLATGHGLGSGGSTTSLGSNWNDSGFGSVSSAGNSLTGAEASQTAAALAAKLAESGYEGSTGGVLSNGRGSVKSSSSRSGTGGRKAAKAAATATNQAIPVFASRPLREFRGHTADVIDLSWSKNNFLMSASTDKTARLWHVSRAECLCTFGHMDFVTGACFHPTDDRFFLSASLDGKLRLWNIPAKKVQYSQEVPGLITACAFTASGKMACAGTFGGAIVLYHTDKLAYATSIAVRSTSSQSTKKSKITGIEPVPNVGSNHERILVSSNDSRIRIYDLGDKSVAHKFKASGYHNKASQIRASISTDGMYIAAGSEDASVYVWEASQGKAYGGLRGAGSKVSRSATRQFAEAAHEYWHTPGSSSSSSSSGLGGSGGTSGSGGPAGAVTCAVVAPLLTHKHLDASEDPIMRRSWRHEIEQARTASSRPLSTLTLSSAISAALPIAFRAGPGRQQVNARLNRIIVTADDTSCVQVWRTDSFDLLGTIKQPMTLTGPSSAAAAAAAAGTGEAVPSVTTTTAPPSTAPPAGGQ